jgi:hypothetical protein
MPATQAACLDFLYAFSLPLSLVLFASAVILLKQLSEVLIFPAGRFKIENLVASCGLPVLVWRA